VETTATRKHSSDPNR